MRKLTDIMAFVKMFFSGGRCARVWSAVGRVGRGYWCECEEVGAWRLELGRRRAYGAAAIFFVRRVFFGGNGMRRGGMECGGASADWRLMAYWLEVLGDDKGVQGAAFFGDKESPFGANTRGVFD